MGSGHCMPRPHIGIVCRSAGEADRDANLRGPVEPVLDFLKDALARRPVGRMLAVGLCGAQGSGKSTLAAQVVAALTQAGHRVAALSLDDLYLTLAERRALAAQVHPLLLTRGVPGTHDVALGERILDAAARAGHFRLPCFDKAADDRVDEREWLEQDGPVDLLLLEGWCVGARAQTPEALLDPVNDLERREDAQGLWRTYVNRQLDGPYRHLFARLDHLILLAAPDFAVVWRWRKQQEDDLRRRTAGAGAGGMDDPALHRFIQHYERLTRHVLSTMPDYADLVVQLDDERRVTGLIRR